MKLRVLHGYFIFEETKVGQVSDFMKWSGLSLVAKDDFYTFESLAAAPDFSLKGQTYMGLPATTSFAGKPWEVMRANGLVFDFDQDVMVPIATVAKTVVIRQAGNRFISNGLILPGSVMDGGARVKDYAAWFSRERLTWLYSEVSSV